MKEFMWKSVTWLVKRHGETLQYRTKFYSGAPWRTVQIQLNNPAINAQFRRLLATAAIEVELSSI